MYLIHKDLETEIGFSAPITKRGEARIEVLDQMGNVVHDTGYFGNSFTTYGDTHAWAKPLGMDLGQDNSATTAGMTDLVDTLTDFSRPTIGAVTAWNVPSAPDWQLWSEVTKQFGASGNEWKSGFVSGQVGEIGLFENWNPRGNDLMCRANLNPVIPITADNIVNAYYRLYVDLPTARVNGQIVINGVTYDTVTGFVALHQTEDTFEGVYPSMFGSNSFTLAFTTSNVLPGLDQRPVDNDAGVPNFDTSSMRSVMGSDVGDEVNKTVRWQSRAELTYGNFDPSLGIRSAFHPISFRRQSGYSFALGVTFIAVDGPNPGGGIPKNDTQWLNLNWRIGYGGVITV